MSNLILKINCAECLGKTCCSTPYLAPILLPSEEKNPILSRYVQKIKTSCYNFMAISKKGSGHCVYFNQKTKRCSVYSNRPLECQIYPFQIEFSENNELKLSLDNRYCKQIKTLEANQMELTQLLKSIDFPDKFIRGLKMLDRHKV